MCCIHPAVKRSWSGFAIRVGGGGRGFAAVEVLIALAVLGMAACVMMVGASRGRANARATESVGKLRQIGALIMQYGGDYQGLSPALSWQPGVTYDSGPWPELARSGEPLVAAAAQAVYIIRRRGNPGLAVQDQWMPCITYTHLVLADHAGMAADDPLFVSPGDGPLLSFRANPASAPMARLPFCSSYEYPAAMYYSGDGPDGGSLRGDSTNSFSLNGGSRSGSRLEPRRLDLMRFPSQKVMVFEQFQRFFGARQAYFMMREARVPMLMGDGSAGVRASGEGAAGAYTSPAGSARSASVYYDPRVFDPTFPGESPVVDGRFRFTHRLLQGVDFGPPLP